MKTIVSEKGQITLPKALRTRLGIRKGQVLEVTEERGRMVLAKAHARDPVDRAYGILKPGRTSDALVEALRGPADLP